MSSYTYLLVVCCYHFLFCFVLFCFVLYLKGTTAEVQILCALNLLGYNLRVYVCNCLFPRLCVNMLGFARLVSSPPLLYIIVSQPPCRGPVPGPYLLTPCCRVILEKLTGLQLVKKFPAFHGTRKFITALTSVRHLSLSWASPIQSIYPHLTSWRSILILSTHLGLGLPSGLLPSGFPTKTL